MLFGQLCEDVYHDQMKMLADLYTAITMDDAAQHGGRTTGSLSRSRFVAVLKSCFPDKNDADIAALVRSNLEPATVFDIRGGTS